MPFMMAAACLVGCMQQLPVPDCSMSEPSSRHRPVQQGGRCTVQPQRERQRSSTATCNRHATCYAISAPAQQAKLGRGMYACVRAWLLACWVAGQPGGASIRFLKCPHDIVPWVGSSERLIVKHHLEPAPGQPASRHACNAHVQAAQHTHTACGAAHAECACSAAVRVQRRTGAHLTWMQDVA